MSYYNRLAKLISAMRIPRCSWRSILRAVKSLKWSGIKRWSGPTVALLVALIILWNLGGKARREIWAYYTDGEDIRISAQENKARSVLWEPPSPTILSKGEEKEKLKEGPSGNFEAAFSADGRQMALVLEREKGSDIFISSWDGRVWSAPELITNINTDSNERGPAFSASGNYLYFSSDRKGGHGGYDIYAALWNGAEWASVKGLGSSINGPDNETGPAPSSDDSILYFSSDRNGIEDQDIYAAVQVPESAPLQFADSIPVKDLNSRSNDIQAALTKKGSHVFLSSDREDDSVFGVYMSRVIGDEVQSPERVDLYIKEDNVTDPAVRMDGFDLLFSTDYGSSAGDEKSDYRLYKSTTREVFGYRDSSRWEEYKNALGKLKWWLIAALLALLALIYLLETWQDITSLLHKCIAASMALHLLLLLLATAWFITQEFEQQSENLSSEIAISLDALSQEELAMESAPEEAEISDPSTQISIEKAESDFNIPELKPQELVENVPEVEAQFQESMDIEIKTSQAEVQEDSIAQKVNESSLIAELSEPILPEIEEALLEEDRNRTTQDKKAAESNNVFEPEIESTELSKAEMDEVSDSAVESETGSESVASGSLVAEATQAESQLTESGGASQETAQTPELASGSLPELALVEPGAPKLEEVTGDPGAQQADPSKDTFEPGGGVASLETVQEEGGAGSDSAVESETGSESVASGSLVAEATQAESQLTESGGASQETAQTPELASGSLPELALVEPGAPKLEEVTGDPGAQQADPSKDTFEPGGGVASLETVQEEGGAGSDSAVESETGSESVASGSLVAEATQAESQLTESGGASQEAAQTPELASGSLPELALVEPGAPKLEEVTGDPGAQQADPSKDTFEPGGGVASLETVQEEGGAGSDSAVESETGSESVASGSLVAEATQAESQLTESGGASQETAQTPELASGSLPELALVEPGAPKLEEVTGDPGAQQADPSKDTFEPGGGVASLETVQEEGGAGSDSTVESETGSESVASGSLVAEATQAESQLTESGGASQETAQTPELASGSLPELALVEPGAPKLEEVTGDPGAQQADPSKDTFEPGGGVASLETVQEEGGAGSDSAVESETGSESVASGSLVAEATQAESQLTESGGASQETAQTPELASGSLPELALVEPGAPKLEEVTGDPGAQQADPSKDTFEPGGGVASLETVQEEGGAGSDSAVESETGSESVASGSLVAEATQAESQLTESGGASQETAQTPELASGSLPELALVEPGAPKLEEVTGDPGAQQADPSKDTFEPGGGVASLETVQEEGGAGSDSAVESETGSESVASGSLVAEATQAESQLTESGGASQETAQTPELASGNLPVYAISAPLLPDSLESNRKELDGGSLTDLIKNHRGKPSIDTIKQMGGSDATEKAIVAAIEWLSKNQEKDGRWDTKQFNAEANYDVGGTGLALLCYYGWGARHDRQGKYQNNVKKALSWLINQQNEDGNLAVSGKMYSHAIGTIALCEAYGITKDSNIKIAAQKAISYTINSQHPQRGGWRYRPGQDSDTSVTGWQFMALHSARMAGIDVPEEPFELARRWLDFAGGGEHGGLYGYKGPSEISRAMVATGMFCRQLDLVPPTDPRMIESAQLLKNNPLRPINPDLYYIYYATLALYQHQGPIWQDWNNKLKETLPKIQNKTGKNAGSWDLSRLMTKGGGRVASTTLAILSLEVYYRILPMYGFRGTDVPEIKLKEGE